MRVMQKFVWPFRQATGRGRVLPDFIIIGAQKAGTTSLFQYLSEHPQLFESFKKEVHFFDGGSNPRFDAYDRGPLWYQAHFPLRRRMASNYKTFEASPLYLFHPLVAERLHRLLPRVKLIALLRHPTERAISHYFHEQRKGREKLPILQAMQAEQERLSKALGQQDFRDPAFRHFSYKQRGLYEQQLRRYLQYFSPEQLLVLGSEKFFADPHTAMRQVLEFVGVDAGFEAKQLKPRNVSKNRQQVDAEVYDYLDAYFAPHYRSLYDLVGQDFGW
jgi:hypothetical protein